MCQRAFSVYKTFSLFTGAMTHGCYGEELWQQRSWLGASDSTWLYSLHLSLSLCLHHSISFEPCLCSCLLSFSSFTFFFPPFSPLFLSNQPLIYCTRMSFHPSQLSILHSPLLIFPSRSTPSASVLLRWPAAHQMWPALPAVGIMIMNKRGMGWKWSLMKDKAY